LLHYRPLRCFEWFCANQGFSFPGFLPRSFLPFFRPFSFWAPRFCGSQSWHNCTPSCLLPMPHKEVSSVESVFLLPLFPLPFVGCFFDCFPLSAQEKKQKPKVVESLEEGSISLPGRAIFPSFQSLSLSNVLDIPRESKNLWPCLFFSLLQRVLATFFFSHPL